MGRIITTPLLEDKLVAFWNLDDASNSNPVVSSYGSYSLNLFGGFTSIAGKINQGVEFGGDYQGLWTNEQLWNLLTNPTSFSVSFWYKIPDNTITLTVMGNAFGSMGFHFDYFNFGHEYDGSYDLNWVPGSYGISFRMSGSADPAWNAIYANEATPNNTWTLVTATYDLPTTTMKLYLNGVLKASYNNANTGEFINPDWHGFALNGSVMPDGKEYGVNQCFDALGFWSRALNQNEISILYNGGNGRQYKFIDNKNKVSIKKQNLGGGKLNLNLYTASDPDARAYISAVETVDGQPLEYRVKKAINDLIIGCKTDGTWTAIKSACLLAGPRTLNGILVPLVGSAPTNVNFTTSDYDRKTGLKGDGSTKYLNSNRANNADPQNSKHVAAYLTESVNRNTVRSIIAVDTPTSNLFLATSIASVFFRINHGDLTPTSFFDLNPILGLIGGSRDSSINVNTRYNQNNRTLANSSTTPSSTNIFIYSRSSLTNYADARMAFYSIGENIDLEKLENRVRDYVNSISAI
jgi:hypothetical protein